MKGRQSHVWTTEENWVKEEEEPKLLERMAASKEKKSRSCCQERMASLKEKKSPSFVKVYLPGVNDQYLTIPPAFLKHINHGAHQTVSLKGPSGNIWHLGLVEEENGLLFVDGWKEFARENSLQVGYLLIFTYHGKLKFTVLVFDTSGCEILGSIAIKNGSVPSHSESNSIPVGGMQSAGGLSSGGKRTHYLEEEEKVKCSKRSMGRPSYKSQSNPYEKRKPKQRPLNTDLYLRSGSLISKRRSVSEEERGRAVDKAKSLVLENPSALVVMRVAHVYFGFLMVLPSKFVTSHFPQKTCEMTVWDPAGRQWSIKYISFQTYGALSAGWKFFCIANNLEEGDVCVFEYIKHKELRVHLFRVVEEITPLINNVVRKRRANRSCYLQL